jgi:hypothetical protein
MRLYALRMLVYFFIDVRNRWDEFGVNPALIMGMENILLDRGTFLGRPKTCYQF